ncbi:putative ATP binding protein, partial [Toxoplasma gondii TgCatPRC2]
TRHDPGAVRRLRRRRRSRQTL